MANVIASIGTDTLNTFPTVGPIFGIVTCIRFLGIPVPFSRTFVTSSAVQISSKYPRNILPILGADVNLIAEVSIGTLGVLSFRRCCCSCCGIDVSC